ncbi:methyl-accepting chemotaxis protein [Pseudomonas capsici]|uniref:Methyl-accepting chemotaxis protein n=2 Tax=Pseudomonas capsici TaxID=2810614 RepID=A0ABT3C270_9PSED|nr:methyl-accepting chemotaxis protein [Pseudomonas capsici]GFM63249.1 methyl-accepting chemotaxis protein [Pseudomonas cichorii]MBN6716688.1 methyl-accepting chemotaxis protein [Pseudomonas capsici]MBN6721704.1 methyl-accepting chemotaxis protein [Pseudomonas capsici]MBN6726762.1 methyl-accepting chemotaxis protein [Pseudomonas capsici]MCV4265668.1 methyl-accepting chemotaxis protein [Pseudomonas capsici]
MKNLSVKFKLIAGFSSVLLVLVITTLIGLHSIQSMTTRAIKSVAINRLIDEANIVQNSRLRYEATRAPQYLQQIDEASARVNKLIADNRNLFSSPEDGKRFDDINNAMSRYSVALKALVEAMRQGNGALIDAAREPLETHFKSAFGTIHELIESQNEKGRQEASFARQQLLALLVIALVLGLGVTWLITRQIQQPLDAALVMARQIGEGNLIGISAPERKDEFGALLSALEQTGLSLRKLLGQVSRVTGELQSAAEELSAVTEQSSNGANSQRTDTDQVAVAMNEMVSTVQHVAMSAAEASNAAKSADLKTSQGNVVAQEALTQIELLGQEINNSNQAVSDLSNESERIGGVLTVINGLASQTNLLALNAAIEAARAGEAGRGFAVVADEVRGLASRTQQSTAEIESLIVSLQNSAQQASRRMEASCQMVENTVGLTRNLQTELNDIGKSVATIQVMSMQVASASEQQDSVVEEINRNMHGIKDVTEQTATATQQIAIAATNLARQGSELQGLIRRFQL